MACCGQYPKYVVVSVHVDRQRYQSVVVKNSIWKLFSELLPPVETIF